MVNRTTLLDDCKSYLHRRWNEGFRNASQLYREVQALGYQGSRDGVGRYIRLLKGTTVVPPAPRSASRPRRILKWITIRPELLRLDEALDLKEIHAVCPELEAATGHVRGFADMMTNLRGHELPHWISGVLRDGLPAIRVGAQGLHYDERAVIAGLSLPWGSGQVEGQVTRVILWNPSSQVAPRSLPLRITAGRLGRGPEDSAAVNMGISGFKPSFLIGIEAVRQAHGSRLTTLVGRRLARCALVRFIEDGDWFADCPVVLDFDDLQVEVCHSKLDELSIGWNTIDTAAPIAGLEWSELTPQWSHGDERLEPFVGQELCEVALLEWRPTEHDLAAGTVAVEFAFADGCLRIVNGLDENRIERGAAQPEYIRHRLGR